MEKEKEKRKNDRAKIMERRWKVRKRTDSVRHGKIKNGDRRITAIEEKFNSKN